MPRSAPTRDGRLELRTTKEEKRLLAAAAAYERNERVVLSGRDTARVLELLEHPPKPTPPLLAAARSFREQTGQ